MDAKGGLARDSVSLPKDLTSARSETDRRRFHLARMRHNDELSYPRLDFFKLDCDGAIPPNSVGSMLVSFAEVHRRLLGSVELKRCAALADAMHPTVPRD